MSREIQKEELPCGCPMSIYIVAIRELEQNSGTIVRYMDGCAEGNHFRFMPNSKELAKEKS